MERMKEVVALVESMLDDFAALGEESSRFFALANALDDLALATYRRSLATRFRLAGNTQVANEEEAKSAARIQRASTPHVFWFTEKDNG